MNARKRAGGACRWIPALGLVALTCGSAEAEPFFRRIATFPVFENTDIGTQTVAEIVAASHDGNTLIYTDSVNESLGFVDITDPEHPRPLGNLSLEGEPTSVAVAGRYALVAVNTSSGDPVVTPDAVSVPRTGELLAVDVRTQGIVGSWELPGQPDSIAVGPEPRFRFLKRYAAIAIESEREEDGVCLLDGIFQPLGEGDCEDAGGWVGPLPQSPAGGLTILEMRGHPRRWSTRTVDLTGLADVAPEDPEPEYVSVNRFNVAVVTLQENNHLALVYLPTGRVLNHFTAGTVDLDQVDVDDDGRIDFSDSLVDLPREPDGTAWISSFQVATADEGDFRGGGRGFTIYDWTGQVQFTAGNSVDHVLASVGHYPEGRSDNKGNEPENVAFGEFGGRRFLFVGSERSSAVLVYELPSFRVRKASPGTHPRLRQILPTQLAPEGLLPIPQRGLLVAANEEDSREDIFRGSLNIYRLQEGSLTYPTIRSADRPDGTPIPWAALSALTVDPDEAGVLYSVHDSVFRSSRVYTIDRTQSPARITGETVLRDRNGRVQQLQDETAQAFADRGLIDQIEGLVDLVNDDETVNLDPEGIAVRAAGGFWIASEGSGQVGDTGRDFSPNLVVGVASDGSIEEAITLPGELAITEQRRFGFEGIASVLENGQEVLYLAFQRPWTAAGDEAAAEARIGRYAGGEWSFAHYPLDPATSPLGGWVGLSEITSLGAGEFAVVERDNQGGVDARVKTLQRFSLEGITFRPAAEVELFDTVSKTLARDLLPDLEAPRGAVIEKVESLAVLPDGTAIIATDNDGVDDSSGETQYIEIPGVF